MTPVAWILLALLGCAAWVCMRDRRQHRREVAAMVAALKLTKSNVEFVFSVYDKTIASLTEQLARAREDDLDDGDGVLSVPPDGRRPS